MGDGSSRLGAWIWLVLLGVGVRVVPFRFLAPRLLRVKASRRTASRAEIAAVADTVVRAARWCRPAPTCLVRSLVLGHRLARRGIETALVVGVSNDEGRFLAHAWLEHAGERVEVGGGPAVRPAFSVMCRVDARGVWPAGEGGCARAEDMPAERAHEAMPAARGGAAGVRGA